MASCPKIGNNEVRTTRPLVYAHHSVLEMSPYSWRLIGSFEEQDPSSQGSNKAQQIHK